MTTDDSSKGPEGLIELNRRLLAYSVRMNRAIANGVAPAIRGYAETAAGAVEAAALHAAKLAECKSPTEAIEEQNAFSRELNDKFQESAKQLLRVQTETNEELESVVKDGLEEFLPDGR